MSDSALTPEEEEQLKAHYGGGGNGEFEDACKGAFAEVAERLQILEQGYADLRRKVDDDLIGGIKSLYDENVKTEGLGALKGKYGSMLEPYAPKFSKAYGGADLWEKLWENVADLSDEERDPKIKGLLDQLKEIFDAKAEEAAPAAAPVGVAMEVTKTAPVGGDEDGLDGGMVKEIEKMKKRSTKGYAK